MAEQTTLLVPIEVSALVVNDEVRHGQNFQRWSMDYTKVAMYLSPEPAPFSSNANDFGTDPTNNGVYLHWTLPQILRQGKHDTEKSTTEFPLVPNRWLVVRYSGDLDARIATAWVIESDFLDPNDGTVPSINPFLAVPGGGVAVTSIGRKVNLNNPQWQESGSNPLFLTAVGPGNVTFAAYQPAVENVFSLHDPLDDVSDSATLSYLVAGWYSNENGDILNSWGTNNDFSQWLTSLEWTVNGEPDSTANISLYHGMVYGIDWQKSGSIPASGCPTTNISVAVGNTSVDALTAMIEEVAQQNGEGNTLNPELLEAFQYGLLHVLDQPDGEEALQYQIHQSWFNGSPGGYRWEIVDAQIEHPKQKVSVPAEELAREEQWLVELNQAQRAYDGAVRSLKNAQWLFFALWWKQGSAQNLPSYPTGITADMFQQQLDPQNQDGALYKLVQQIAAVNALRQKIPHGQTPKELAQSIAVYTQTQNLPATRELKRSTLPHFWQATDPVVLISGTNASSQLTDDEPLLCRFPDQLVTGLTYQGNALTASSLQNGIPTVDLTNIPAIMSDLLTEFFFLDPNNATLLAAGALQTSDPSTISDLTTVMAAYSANIGQLPAFPLNTWEQPWEPLFMMWEVYYYPIDYETDGTVNWTFDGSQYTWTGNGAAATTDIVLSGRIFLTPQCQFNFKSRLEQYLQNNPDADLQALDNFISQTEQWDFLSQTLSGFKQQLILRDPLGGLLIDDNQVLYPPDMTLKRLVSHQADYAPLPGTAQEIPFQGWPPSGFQQYRGGQFFFNRLMVIDTFGQALDIVTSGTGEGTNEEQFQPIIANGLVPEQTVLQQEPYRFVQLPPRLLQPGRLNFEYVSSTDDSKIIDLDAGINPVCAWILPNHLDQALSCYDNQGAAIGEMHVITDDQQQQTIYWEAAPNSPCLTLPDVVTTFPHLGQFLTALSQKTPQDFYNLLQIIDETLWTIDPLGERRDTSLSVLVGRPLALVRSRLQFQLDGPAVADPSWRYTFSPQTPDFPQYPFPIVLGNLNLRQDGLLGYFSGTNYDQFNAVYYPQDGEITQGQPPYVVPISTTNCISDLSFDGQSAAFLTMLVDPRASVHATTGILPVTTLDLPTRYVDPALRAMEVIFHIGPLLSDSRVLAKKSQQAENSPTTLIMPKPSEKHGTWSWLEYAGESWNAYDIAAADQSVRFSNVPAALRTGLLKLSGAMQKK